jgi:sulfatase modifying factor 1
MTRKRHWFYVAALLLSVLGGARADLTFDLTPIGNAGSGGVGYSYSIGTFEVTVAQYTEFLNAKAASDPNGLYNGSMETGPLGAFIVRTGSEGSYSYSAVSGKENQPVRIVSFYDAMRFVNWVGNGQGSGDTENGAYDLSLGIYATRQTNATWVIPSSEEWAKAAYYDAVSNLYHLYPNGSDEVPQEPTDGTTPREMNFGDIPYWHGTVCFTSTGETTGHSPYGVYDMGGNVNEWTDSISDIADFKITRGGSFLSGESALQSSQRTPYEPTIEGDGIGFRVAYIIPEPSTCLLILLGVPVAFVMRKRR